VQRVADNEVINLVLADEAQQAAEVFTARLTPYSKQRLCGIS
jgi:hypothetical protein